MSTKRSQVAAACNACRDKKTKCDAARPACGRCRARGLTCYYGVEPGTTRAVAHKRRHAELQDRHDGLVELYNYLRTRSEPEVMEILRRIRETEDPLAVVRLVRDGDILLQRRLSGAPADDDLKQFDEDALRKSNIKVASRPWTVVAGDGIVSYLISQYFNREQRFCVPFIHRNLFLADIAQGDPATAFFCSPLLVNALCAFGAFGSEYIRSIDAAKGGSLRSRFYEEAKRLFDREAGRATLPTTQALNILYMYSTSAAMDRAGLVFRFASCEMFKRLGLGSKMPSRPRKYNKRTFNAAIARNAWGLFFTESLVAFTYLQASLIAVPTLPRYFVGESNIHDPEDSHLLDSDDVLDALSNGTAILYSIVSYSASKPDDLGSISDIEKRRNLYNRICDWSIALPSMGYYAPLEFRQWHYLRCFFHFGAIAVFRPLQDVETSISGVTRTPAEICISHCNSLISEMDECRQVFPSDFDYGSLETLFFHYLCAFTLVMMLNLDARCHGTFVKCCRYLYDVKPYWPAATALLVGLQALGQQLDARIPAEAIPYLAETPAIDTSNNDLPISWAVPRHGDLLELFSDDGGSTEKMSIELGTIISRWAAQSM